MKILAILLMVSLSLSSCRKSYENENHIIIRAEGRIKQHETMVYQNKDGYYTKDFVIDDFTEPEKSAKERAERIESLVLEFKEINKVSVIVLENRAIVGIKVLNTTEYEALEKDVAKVIKNDDESINHVTITFDSDLIEVIDNAVDFQAFKYIDLENSIKM